MKINVFLSLTLAATSALLASCAMTNREGTLASLNDVEFEVKEEKVDGSLEKALASYQKFLEETPETEMTPEALRRLADLKIQKEYVAKDLEEAQQKVQDAPATGVVAGELPVEKTDGLTPIADSASQATDIQTPDTSFVAVAADKNKESIASKDGPIADISESEKAFSERAGKKIDLGSARRQAIVTPGDKSGQDAIDLQEAGAKEAIELYKGLLKKYPLFERLW